MARFENLNVTKINYSGIGAGQTGPGAFYIEGKNINISANATTDTQTTQALVIPAGTHVINVFSHVVTAANATCTATLGDGDSATGWDAAINLTAAAGTRLAGVIGTDAFAVGKRYASADTIDATITFSTTTTTGVFRLDALCTKF